MRVFELKNTGDLHMTLKSLSFDEGLKHKGLEILNK